MSTTPMKIVVNVNFPATLRAYQAMDLIGLKLSSDFPDWMRQALQLDLFNKQRHERLLISHKRLVYEIECFGELPEAAITRMKNAIYVACDLLNLTAANRIGFRQYYALNVSNNKGQMLKKLDGLVFSNVDRMSAMAGGTVVDMAYTLEMNAEKDRFCRLHIGPMEREEWSKFVPSNGPHYSGEQVLEQIEAMPSNFVFADLDWGLTTCDVVEFDDFADEILHKGTEFARNFIEFYGDHSHD